MFFIGDGYFVIGDLQVQGTENPRRATLVDQPHCPFSGCWERGHRVGCNVSVLAASSVKECPCHLPGRLRPCATAVGFDSVMCLWYRGSPTTLDFICM